MRRKILISVGILVSAIFLWLAFHNVDISSIREFLSTAKLYWAAPFLAVLFGFYWLKSLRWMDLLSPACNVRSHELFPIVMIGYAGSALLPMQMGEFVRAYIASKRYSLPYSLVLSSIGMERIFDLMTILTLLGFVLANGQSTPEALVKAGYVIAALTAVGLLTMLLLVTRTEYVVSVIRIIFSWLPAEVMAEIVRQLFAASRGLTSVTKPRLLFRIAINSILQWSLMGLCIWFSLIALGISVPVSGVALVLVATIIGISLPTSPGYVGNIQFAFVISLQPFGITAGHAIAASLFYHVLAYMAVVIVGFTFLHKLGYSMSKVEIDARASNPKPD